MALIKASTFDGCVNKETGSVHYCNMGCPCAGKVCAAVRDITTSILPTPKTK